ncbi:MAG TPA: DUF4012 domain-containing protein [Actinomycetota bacterium]|nr:DUF4012 domain-containing protein [Actinomycetota bacterium]
MVRVLATLALALAFALLFMPIAEIIGKQFGHAVRPRLFKRSKRKVSYLGGSALVPAALAASTILWGIPKPVLPVLGGALLVFSLGLWDDRLHREGGLLPWHRFALEASTAAGVWVLGLRPSITGLYWVDFALTVLFLIASCNAVNLIDNMDGVAGTTVAVIASGTAALALISGQLVIAGVAAGVTGATLGFLQFNFHRARLYLGDSGSLFLGFTLGGLLLSLRLPLGFGGGFVVAIALMGIPFTDTAVRQIARWLTGKSLFDVTGGIDHVSHNLVAMGLSTKQVALTHGFFAAVGVAAGIYAAASLRIEAAFAAIAMFSLIGVAFLAVSVSKQRGKAKRRRAFVLALGLIGLLALGSAPAAISARRHLESAKRSLQLAATVARAGSLSEADSLIGKAERDAAIAAESLGGPTTFVARSLPLIGTNLKAARSLAYGTNLIARSSRDALKALSEVSSGGYVAGRIDLEKLSKAAPSLERAAAGAELAVAAVPRDSKMLLPQVSGARDEFERRATDAAHGLGKASRTLEVLPAMLGADGPRTWFLAVQNGAELRATGGFIGGFGILRTNGGAVELVSLEPDRFLPVPPSEVDAPDEVIARYDRFGARSGWQNVNMVADFPTAARMMAGMWELSTGEAVDGVIAVDAVAIGHLLGAVGPVDVPALGKQVTSDNVVDVTLREAYGLIEDREERQDVLVDVGRETFTRLTSGTYADPRLVINGLSAAASSKHLLLWSRHEEKQLGELDLDGSISGSPSSDYLMVVSQNASANKLDYYARRGIEYSVDLQAGAAMKADLTVRVDNNTPSDLPAYVLGPDGAAVNRAYLSVYVPESTDGRLAKIDGKNTTLESHREVGLGVLSQFVETNQGAQSKVDLSLVGRDFKPGEYRLLARKQPTPFADDFKLEVTLPPGAAVSEMTPGMRQNGNTVTWSGKLSRDREFFVRYEIQNEILGAAWNKIASLADSR